MLDHLFDIDGNSKIEFEKIDFAATEIKIGEKVVWHRNHGLAEELNMEGE